MMDNYETLSIFLLFPSPKILIYSVQLVSIVYSPKLKEKHLKQLQKAINNMTKSAL